MQGTCIYHMRDENPTKSHARTRKKAKKKVQRTGKEKRNNRASTNQKSRLLPQTTEEQTGKGSPQRKENTVAYYCCINILILADFPWGAINNRTRTHNTFSCSQPITSAPSHAYVTFSCTRGLPYQMARFYSSSLVISQQPNKTQKAQTSSTVMFNFPSACFFFIATQNRPLRLSRRRGLR